MKTMTVEPPQAIQRFLQVARLLLPPVFLPALRRLRRILSGVGAEWEFLGSEWPAISDGEGWLHQSIVQAQSRKWPAVVVAAGENGPLGIAHEASSITREDTPAHNTIMTFAYVLALAAQSRDVLTVLDWGGGIGQYALLAHSLLLTSRLDYRILELAPTAAAGRRLNPTTLFYDNPQQLGEELFDIVIASSSLQYAKDWQFTLQLLASHSRRYLFVTRLPTVRKAASYVTLQRPHAVGYHTEYPAWVLNKTELMEKAGTMGLLLLREFLVAERHVIPGAPEQPAYRGFLFEVR